MTAAKYLYEYSVRHHYGCYHILGFPCGSASKESTCHSGDVDSIPGLGRSLEKGKATHSSILAWRIPWTVESMGSQRVGHD